MGMYTALHLAVELRADTPPDVISVLRFMTGQSDQLVVTLPDHPLFGATRWQFMLRMDSACFAATTHSIVEEPYTDGSHYLTVLSNFKNYGEEIDKFVDWISPYIADHISDWIGYRWYEEAEEPTAIYRRRVQ